MPFLCNVAPKKWISLYKTACICILHSILKNITFQANPRPWCRGTATTAPYWPAPPTRKGSRPTGSSIKRPEVTSSSTPTTWRWSLCHVTTSTPSWPARRRTLTPPCSGRAWRSTWNVSLLLMLVEIWYIRKILFSLFLVLLEKGLFQTTEKHSTKWCLWESIKLFFPFG